MGNDCPFCNVESMKKSCIFPDPATCGEDWENTSHAFVINVLAPDLPGHCMVIPRRHVETLSELEYVEIQGFFQIAEMVIKKLKGHFGYEAFTPFWLVGKTRSLSHFHLHIVPKMVIKSRSKEEKEAAKLGPEEMAAMVEKLRGVLKQDPEYSAERPYSDGSYV